MKLCTIITIISSRLYKKITRHFFIKFKQKNVDPCCALIKTLGDASASSVTQIENRIVNAVNWRNNWTNYWLFQPNNLYRPVFNALCLKTSEITVLKYFGIFLLYWSLYYSIQVSNFARLHGTAKILVKGVYYDVSREGPSKDKTNLLYTALLH